MKFELTWEDMTIIGKILTGLLVCFAVILCFPVTVILAGCGLIVLLIELVCQFIKRICKIVECWLVSIIQIKLSNFLVILPLLICLSLKPLCLLSLSLNINTDKSSLFLKNSLYNVYSQPLQVLLLTNNSYKPRPQRLKFLFILLTFIPVHPY